MSSRAVTKLTVVVALVGVAVAPAAALSAVDARVTGTFAMRARVTSAVNVRGEHSGQVLARRWIVAADGCAQNVCSSLDLHRQRSAGRYADIKLTRTGPGRYVGHGVFYVALRCRGRIYRRGSRAPYRIAVTVAKTMLDGGVRFARTIRASYVNVKRSNRTPCALGSSRDSARYTGRVTGGLPSPPAAAFASRVDAATDTVSFADTSAAGSNPIVGRAWDFGDPAAPSGGTSTTADPTHAYASPGDYAVALTVTDAQGLTSTITQTVIVPG